MREDYVPDENSMLSRLFCRGIPLYYVGSMVFAVGIALVGLGSVLIMIFQLHYGSEPEKILYTVVSIGVGIPLILIGINLMMKERMRGYLIITASALMSSVAIYLFSTNYLTNWYYPLISYILGLYVIGFLILMGNAFANVIIWIIERRLEPSRKEEEKSRLYKDEEIQRDIEEATRKSIEAAASELQFEIEKMPEAKRFGKAVMGAHGHITRVRDDIDESFTLKQTMHPGTTEKWGSIGVEKASYQLANAIIQRDEEKGRFAKFKEAVVKKFSKYAK